MAFLKEFNVFSLYLETSVTNGPCTPCETSKNSCNPHKKINHV